MKFDFADCENHSRLSSFRDSLIVPESLGHWRRAVQSCGVYLRFQGNLDVPELVEL
jgi:hypothetical protein